MAKTKKRPEAASPIQSVLTPGDRANGLHAGTIEDPRDRIAHRAYELYLARGGAHGADFDDWITAERELTGSNAQPVAGRVE
jgi:hypothetical protein